MIVTRFLRSLRSVEMTGGASLGRNDKGGGLCSVEMAGSRRDRSITMGPIPSCSSDCLGNQVKFGFQASFFATIVLSIVISFLMHAMIAVIFALPLASRC